MAIENLPSHLDPNDPMVKQAQRGKGWGEQDQRRYDKLKGTLVGQKEARDMSEGGLRKDYAALAEAKSSGAEDPAAISVAPTTSADKDVSLVISSKIGTKWFSHRMCIDTNIIQIPTM